MTDHHARAGRASSAWAHARAFSLRDWLDLIESAALLAWSHVALRVTSPARAVRRATVTRRPRAEAFTAARLARVAWLVGVAGRHVVPVPCLTRSVALARVLARRGVQTKIRVGVRTIDGRLDAHAWVELDGRPLNDDEATISRYAPFDRPLGDLAAIQSEIR